MVKKSENKSFESLSEIGLEKDISSYLEKVGQTVFDTFEKYDIPPNPIGSWGLLSQAAAPEFHQRMQCIQEEFHQKIIPLPLDLIQAQAIVPHLAKAEKSLALGNCEELAFHVGSIVNNFAWPNRFQPHLAGQKKSGKKSPLTTGVSQLVQYAEDSPSSYKAEKVLELIEILANDNRFADLNKLELEPDLNNPNVYKYKIHGEEKTIGKRSLINAIYRERNNIRNSNTS